jgi:hypothetical protein
MSMRLTNLPVSRETDSSTPATVILVTYCMLLKLVIFCTVEAEARRLRSAGEGPERACRGNIAALTLTDRSRIVRSKESDIKERIEERREQVVRNKRGFAQPGIRTKKKKIGSAHVIQLPYIVKNPLNFLMMTLQS